MKVFILIGLCASCIAVVKASPFERDVEDGIGKSEFLSMPYTKQEIMAVRAKLNLSQSEVDPDEYLSVPELITKYGYPVEEHFTTTKDGYILRMHRIPPTKKGVTPCHRTIFLMHGILMSSADYVILGPNKALAYHLADLGYDVWMGNARGNTQSRNHTKISPKKSKFWNFSWHEIGTKDLPAMIDYVLKTTKQKALYYVGHSQGTTTFYVMCSELPHYNKKIIAHYSLAPIAFMKHAVSPILQFASHFDKIGEVLTNLLGIHEILAHSDLITWLGNHICAADDLSEFICKDTLFLICGFDKAEFNATLLPTLMGHTPAGASMRQMYHYAQLLDSGKFQQYDYSPLNALHYGPLHPIWPPSYDLKKISAPVYLYYSENDWLSHPKDVEKLCDELKNCVNKTLVSETKFNHLDYILGIHAKEEIYTVLSNDIANHVPKKEQLGTYEESEDDDSYADDDSSNSAFASFSEEDEFNIDEMDQ